MPPVRRLRLAGLVLLATTAAAPGVPEAQPGVPVEVAQARLLPVVIEVPLTGTVTTARRASLSPRVSGLVSRVHVDAGDRVAGGDRLLSLDPTLAELELGEARAAVAEARAALAEARRRRDEARELGPRRGIPETEIRAAEAEVQVRAAALERLRAAQRYREELVARHELYAPFPGVVASRHTEAGEWVETGTPVLELVGSERLRLDLRVPQEHYPRIGPDTGVSVRLDAWPDRVVEGRIVTRVPVNDPGSRTFLLRVVLEDGELGVTPGMSAQAVLRVQSARRAVTVPRDAVLRDAYGTSRVWLVEESESGTRAAQREVVLGRSFDGRVEVRRGIEAGERVVVRGNETLRDGQRLRIVGET